MAFADKFKKWLFILSIIGPGIITAAVDNDAGGIATYSLAGAQFGYGLLWSLIPITVLLIWVQEMCARMGVVTGKGLADLIRERFGLKITVFIMLGLLFANLVVMTAEFAGIATAGELFGIPRLIMVPIAAVMIWFAIIYFNYKTLERLFLFITLFYAAYIISGVMAHPDWGDVFRQTIIPSFQFSSGYLILLVGVLGTTITPWMQFYLQSSIVEKGIRKEEYKYARWDVIIGCILTDVVAFFIIVASASVIFKGGSPVNSVQDIAAALLPLAGKYVFVLFGIGLFAAALFGAFILPISTSFYVCEALGWESGVNKKFRDAKAFYVLLSLMIVLSALVILIPTIPLLHLMLTAQVINGVMLPIILIAILKLSSSKRLMGDYVNPRWLTRVGWFSVFLMIVISITMIVTTFF
ncbi:Nramp family divalent metal transporter [Candidatus Woesearchaeota archaeon]|nr:Nramp family divalent metal transporter [Candidatus Woesearchaeota archaeon]